MWRNEREEKKQSPIVERSCCYLVVLWFINSFFVFKNKQYANLENKRADEQEGKEVVGGKAWSQDLEPPGGLVFVVQAVCGVKVELPRGGCSLLFVIQAVGGVEGQAGAAVSLVVVVMVVVAWRLADVVVRVAWHGGGRHRAELVGVVVGVHGGQVGAAVYAAEVRAGRGGVALTVARRLVVGHGVGGGGGGGAWHWTLHTGGVGRGSGLRERGCSRSRSISGGDSRAPDGGDCADGGRGAAERRRARVIGGGGWRRGRARAGDGRWRELAAALRAGALPGRGRLLLGRPGFGTAAALLLLATLGPPVLEPHLQTKNSSQELATEHTKQPQRYIRERYSQATLGVHYGGKLGVISYQGSFPPRPLGSDQPGV